jgi:hypothetical protein
MMNIKISGKSVDVYDAKCATRSCFRLGQDKGVFVQGRGYTKYHAKPRWVCMRRHLSGCPSVGVCANDDCRYVLLEGETVCSHCGTAIRLEDA